MEGVLFGWLGEMIYSNGHLTPIAGFIIVAIVMGAITKYFIYPTHKRLERIEEEMFPDVIHNVETSFEVTQEILHNQSKVISDTILHNKTVCDMDKDVSDIKSAVGKIEAMFSILGLNTNRGIK